MFATENCRRIVAFVRVVLVSSTRSLGKSVVFCGTLSFFIIGFGCFQIVILDLSDRLRIFPLHGFLAFNLLIVFALISSAMLHGRFQFGLPNLNLNRLASVFNFLGTATADGNLISAVSVPRSMQNNVAVMLIVRREVAEKPKSYSASA